jgi:Phage tail tube protein, GTA-gp10
MANALRGESTLVVGGVPRLLRPTFTALVAAEEELGPLFALVERAGAGQLRVNEMTALFWHCLAAPEGLSRELVGDAVARQGLAACAPVLRALLAQILQGAG